MNRQLMCFVYSSRAYHTDFDFSKVEWNYFSSFIRHALGLKTIVEMTEGVGDRFMKVCS